VRALVRAGAQAAFKSAFEAAERHLLSAVQVSRAAGLADSELSALSPVATVFWRQSMFQDPFHPMMERAENLARGLGREGEAADFLFMRMVAAYSAVRPDRAELARRLYEQGAASLDPIVRAYGSQAWGQHQWELGNIGEAVRHLNDGNRIMGSVPITRDSPLRTDLRPVGPLLEAVVATISDDLGAAHALLDGVRATAGDDPYSIAVWAHFATMAAAMAGDTGWALTAAEPWTAADPQHLHSNVDPYLRITTCWARALTGDDPAGAAAEADRILTTTLVDPPRFGLAFHDGLIADMLLSAGMPGEAAAALDRADQYLDDYGQRYAEGLLLLLRARQLWAHGESASVVREIGKRAVALSNERGAHLFARRTEEFLMLNGPALTHDEAIDAIDPGVGADLRQWPHFPAA
jgi:hypothetical protein